MQRTNWQLLEGREEGGCVKQVREIKRYKLAVLKVSHMDTKNSIGNTVTNTVFVISLFAKGRL